MHYDKLKRCQTLFDSRQVFVEGLAGTIIDYVEYLGGFDQE